MVIIKIYVRKACKLFLCRFFFLLFFFTFCVCLQFYLDMKFVICFASQGRYLSRNLHRVVNEIISKAMAAFASTGMDPNRQATSVCLGYPSALCFVFDINVHSTCTHLTCLIKIMKFPIILLVSSPTVRRISFEECLCQTLLILDVGCWSTKILLTSRFQRTVVLHQPILQKAF